MGGGVNHPNHNPDSTTGPPWAYPLLFAATLLVCAIFLSRQTPPPDLFEHSDRLAHAGGFFALVLLGHLTTPRIGTPFPLLLTALLALAVGSEWIQGTELLPQRHGDGWDLAANLSGYILGLMAAMIFGQLKRKPRPYGLLSMGGQA